MGLVYYYSLTMHRHYNLFAHYVCIDELVMTGDFYIDELGKTGTVRLHAQPHAYAHTTRTYIHAHSCTSTHTKGKKHTMHCIVQYNQYNTIHNTVQAHTQQNCHRDGTPSQSATWIEVELGIQFSPSPLLSLFLFLLLSSQHLLHIIENALPLRFLCNCRCCMRVIYIFPHINILWRGKRREREEKRDERKMTRGKMELMCEDKRGCTQGTCKSLEVRSSN